MLIAIRTIILKHIYFFSDQQVSLEENKSSDRKLTTKDTIDNESNECAVSTSQNTNDEKEEKTRLNTLKQRSSKLRSSFKQKIRKQRKLSFSENGMNVSNYSSFLSFLFNVQSLIILHLKYWKSNCFLCQCWWKEKMVSFNRKWIYNTRWKTNWLFTKSIIIY